MANQRPIRTRTLAVGFMVVMPLMTSGAAFSVLSVRRAGGQTDKLVADSLERSRLIGLMRLDSVLLLKNAEDHLTATSDEERANATQAMEVTLRELKDISEQYSVGLSDGEKALWSRLSEVAEQLVKKVDTTITASRRAEAERARKHLEEEAKPVSFELDDLASALVVRNAADVREVLAHLQESRLRTSTVGAGVVLLALVGSLLVAGMVLATLRRQERVIEAQVGELNRRNAELDAFASRVAHDLVAPLAPLRGYLTLARRQTGDVHIKELLSQAESSTARMSELVEGLLRFCRAGKSNDKATGELDTAVTTILLEQGQAASAANIKLERHIEANLSVKCPPQLLQSIAQNLLSNAVKYTAGRPEAAIAVTVRRERDSGVLLVADNGPGLSRESLQSLFQPFFRAPELRAIPGTGLGLATTRRLVEAHGGTIEVESRLGLGTRVLVRLPLSSAPS